MLDRLIRAFLVVGSVSVACAWTWPGAFPAADPRRPVGRRVARGHLCAPRQPARGHHRTRRNILVSGGTASGNTTLLNVLIALIPDDQRIVPIEDTLELRIERPELRPVRGSRFTARSGHDPRPRAPRLAAPARSHRRRQSARHRSGRPVASPQHRTRRLARHATTQASDCRRGAAPADRTRRRWATSR